MDGRTRAPALQPGGTDDWEADYYRKRLRNPELVEAGLVVVIDGWQCLAVPVGSGRRGGYVSVEDVVTGLAVRSALAGQPGFPDVRLRWSPHPDTCHVVEWGDRVPDTDDDVERGRFYGYSEQAIDRFTEEKTPHAHRQPGDARRGGTWTRAVHVD
jgi:hypothetical protein